MAEAFATIFELAGYLPNSLVQVFGDEYTNLINRVDGFDPEIIRLVFPAMAERGALEYTDEEGDFNESAE